MEFDFEKVFHIPEKFKVHFATAIVQLLYSGFQVISKAAVSSGTSLNVLAFYRAAIAALLLCPIAYILERKERPALNLPTFLQMLMSSVIGISLNQSLYLIAIYKTSATFTATIQNLIPACTFLLAVLIRMEKVRIGKREGQAKTIGTIISISGAMVLTLYKGPSLIKLNGRRSLEEIPLFLGSDLASWRVGALCALGNCVTWAIWIVVQVPLLRRYPAPLSVAAFTFSLGAIQLGLVAAFLERDISQWELAWDIELAAVLYGGIIASGIALTLHSWCASKGGPVLVAAYQPLQAVLVTIWCTIFLSETFYMGSLLGGGLIFVGLYLVVWGKKEEQKYLNAHAAITYDDDTTLFDPSIKEPLLV